MNWFDLTVSIALILAMISGIRKGLIMQLAGLAIVIISAVFGGELAKIIQPWIMSTFSMEFSSASVLSYIIAFLAISLLIFFRKHCSRCIKSDKSQFCESTIWCNNRNGNDDGNLEYTSQFGINDR